MSNKYAIKKVLISPLDWGLGHATRCIPLIKAFQKHQINVVVACNTVQKQLLQQEFPNLDCITLEGYNVQYSQKKVFFALKIIAQLPKIAKSIFREHRWLQTIVTKHAIDLVISDNRYGLYTNQVPCIFITHQLNIKAPFALAEKLMQHINYQYINRFTACWVPDNAGAASVAGQLSNPKKMPTIPVSYLGLLSRFKFVNNIVPKYNLCILLSGPEPQRTLLENIILQQLPTINGKIVLVRGLPNNTAQISNASNVLVINHLTGNDLQLAILQSNYVISRCGYTTVMELLELQKKMILIPTPGQTEQEYLANYLASKGWCITANQNQINISVLLQQAEKYAYRQTTPQIFTEQKLAELLDGLPRK